MPNEDQKAINLAVSARVSSHHNAGIIGLLQHLHLMHFAVNEALWPYAIQLKRLFRKFNVPSDGSYRAAAKYLFVTKMEWPLKTAVDRLPGR